MRNKKSDRCFITITYGCQMNESDTEKINGQLMDMGFVPVDTLLQADLIILNTCCVREKAEEKLRGKLGEIKKIKEKRPHTLVGIGGCMMQQNGVGKKMLQRFPYVDFVFGPHTLDQLPNILEESEEKRVLALEEDRFDVPLLPQKRASTFRAWVSIIKGCNNFCSYCIVPYVRGQEVSRPAEEILAEVETLAEQGYKEIVLLGQNVNAYGRDRTTDDFPSLLERLNAIEGVERIRYMTSHPRDYPLELVDHISSLKRVCEHFHLPIQSGSNTILKAMNRGYTREDYLQLAHHIKAKMPQASITTDIIVGFPGETEKDFQRTLEVVQEVGFDSAFMFLYSPRTGTKAHDLEDPIPVEKKKEWLKILMSLQDQISLQRNQEVLGKTLEVMVEGLSKKNKNLYMGRTRTNKPVIFEGNALKPGDSHGIKIEEVQPHTLFGTIAVLANKEG